MRDISNYFGYYNNIDDLSNKFEQVFQVKYRKAMVSEQIRKYKPKRILEIGCAMNSQAIDEKFDEWIIVEPGKQFIDNARKDLTGKNVTYINELFENCVEQCCKYDFDFIIIGSLLHELEEPQEFIDKVKMVSSDKTIIHINVPNANSLHRLLAFEMGIVNDVKQMTFRNYQLQQNRVYDLQTITSFIENNNGIILDKGSYFVKMFTHAQMMACVEHGIIDNNLIDACNRITKYMPELGSEIFLNFKWNFSNKRICCK